MKTATSASGKTGGMETTRTTTSAGSDTVWRHGQLTYDTIWQTTTSTHYKNLPPNLEESIKRNYFLNRWNGVGPCPDYSVGPCDGYITRGDNRWKYEEGTAEKIFMEIQDRMYLVEVAATNPALFLKEMTPKRHLSRAERKQGLGLDIGFSTCSSSLHHLNLQREFAEEVARVKAMLARGVSEEKPRALGVEGVTRLVREKITRLAPLLRDDSWGTQYYALYALDRLVRENAENSYLIVQTPEIILNIIELFKNGRRQKIQSAAGDFLRRFVGHPENRWLINGMPGVLESLEGLLKEGTAEVKRQGAGALGLPARDDPEKQRAIATPQRAALHSKAPTAESKTEEVIRIESLVVSLKDREARVRQNAAHTLAELAASSSPHQAYIGWTEGAVGNLVSLLEDGSVEVRINAAAALRNLAMDNATNQTYIGGTKGAIESLVDLLEDNHPEVRAIAEQTLTALASV